MNQMNTTNAAQSRTHGRMMHLYRMGRISRRTFMEYALASGIGLTAGLAFMGQVAAQTPRSGGHLRFGFQSGNSTDSFDPATLDSTFNQVLGYGATRNALTEVRPDGSVGADLAETWESADQARRWIFNLRPGVTFHNGKSLTPADVIASLQYHIGEDSTSSAKPLVSDIASMRALSPSQIEVVLNGSNAGFPFYMSAFQLGIVPSDGEGKVDATSGIGTGPYIPENFEPGVRASLRRNPNYHRTDEPGYLDSFEMIRVPDSSARANALQNGELDFFESADRKTAGRLASRRGIALYNVEGNQHYSFPMRANEAPFDNNEVRLAVKAAVNREALLQTILQGFGSVGNDHPIGKGNLYLDRDLPQRTYDPDRARSFLRRANLDSIKIQIHVSDAAFAGAIDSAVLMREAMAPAGIDLEIVQVPSDGYWNSIWRIKPFSASYWAGRATEDQMFSTVYASGVPWNETAWEHVRFNVLLKEGRAETDPTRRAAIYAEMQQIVRDEGAALIPLFANYVGAYREEVVGLPEVISGSFDWDGLRAPARWWRKTA